ncbi:hypothetical protein FRB96_002182 [Tulasnella sp. 330]|nr:hypothetical protein FRB96_002182 [Tulasnella sp. 330]
MTFSKFFHDSFHTIISFIKRSAKKISKKLFKRDDQPVLPVSRFVGMVSVLPVPPVQVQLPVALDVHGSESRGQVDVGVVPSSSANPGQGSSTRVLTLIAERTASPAIVTTVSRTLRASQSSSEHIQTPTHVLDRYLTNVGVVASADLTVVATEQTIPSISPREDKDPIPYPELHIPGCDLANELENAVANTEDKADVDAEEREMVDVQPLMTSVPQARLIREVELTRLIFGASVNIRAVDRSSAIARRVSDPGIPSMRTLLPTLTSVVKDKEEIDSDHFEVGEGQSMAPGFDDRQVTVRITSNVAIGDRSEASLSKANVVSRWLPEPDRSVFFTEELPNLMTRRPQHSADTFAERGQLGCVKTKDLGFASRHNTPHQQLILPAPAAASVPTITPERESRHHHASITAATDVFDTAPSSPTASDSGLVESVEEIPVEEILRADLAVMDRKIMVLAEFAQRLGSIVGIDPLGPECVDHMLSCDYESFVAFAGPRLLLTESNLSQTLGYLAAKNTELAVKLMDSDKKIDDLKAQANELHQSFDNLESEHANLQADHNRLGQHCDSVEARLEDLQITHNDLAIQYDQMANASKEAPMQNGHDETIYNRVAYTQPKPSDRHLDTEEDDHVPVTENMGRRASMGAKGSESTNSTWTESYPLESGGPSGYASRSRNWFASQEEPYHTLSVPTGPYMGNRTGTTDCWANHTGPADTEEPQLVYDDARHARRAEWSSAVFPL